MLKFFLGIKLNHSPVIAWLLIITIVAVQLVNKFVFRVKASEGFMDYKSIQEAARENNAGFSDPFFQIAAADMYAEGRKYNTNFIVNAIIYYFFLASGLILSECLLGHFNMIMLVIVGIMVSYLTPAMTVMSCNKGVGMPPVGGVYCCGEYFAWFMSGITMAILLNYHFLKTKKVSTFMFGLLFLVFGLGVLMYQSYFNMKHLNDPVMKALVPENVGWCIKTTTSVVPYLLGGLTTMGMMGLLLRTH
jgi:hypothetical protein